MGMKMPLIPHTHHDDAGMPVQNIRIKLVFKWACQQNPQDNRIIS